MTASLRDTALDFFADLPAYVRNDLGAVIEAFQRRFDDRKLAETYRVSLNSLKKTKTETLEEFTDRVRKNVSKAYPGIWGTSLFESLLIEHTVNGFTDSSTAYDVMMQKPTSVEEAMDLVQWAEACRVTQGRKGLVRQMRVMDVDEDHEDEVNVRKIGGKPAVTEERLNQFGRELMAQLKKVPGKKPNDRDMSKIKCYGCGQMGHYKTSCPEETTCYKCGEKGHMKRQCPHKEVDPQRATQEDGDDLN